jgi:DNA-directed RNA polymerase I, II, and III subunit RPABC1
MLSRRGYIVPPHVAHETQQQFDAMYTRKKVEEELTTEQLVSDDSAATGLFTNVLPDYTSTQPSVARSPPKTDLNAPLCDETSAPLNYSETPLNVGVGSENVNVLDFTVQLAQNTSQTLMVFFPCDTDKNNIGIAPIRNYLTVMDTHNCKHAILVVYENLTSPAVLMLKDLEAKGIFVSFFAESELMYDIYEHVRVPRHILLTPLEKQQLLKKLNATECLLPKMQRHDPMARYLGLRVGDVVKIQRYSMTVAHDVYYRVVVDSEDFC